MKHAYNQRKLYLNFYRIILKRKQKKKQYKTTSNIDIASYGDDTAPYIYGENVSLTIASLEKGSGLRFQWFSDIYMKANENKCHVLLSTNENVLVNTNTKKQFQKTICNQNLIPNYILKTIQEAYEKSTTVSGHMNPGKRSVFFSSQFFYCPLTWMFHGGELNYKVNRLHESCLRVV